MAQGLLGLRAISAGAIDGYARRLDEATAAVVAGEQTSPTTFGWTCC